MKLMYKNPNLRDGETVISCGISVKNGDVHDFAKFGEDQRHFEIKALGNKLWVRTDDTGSEIEDAVIVEDAPKKRGRPAKVHGNT